MAWASSLGFLLQATQTLPSLGLEGADGDLNEESSGVTGLGCPAGYDVAGNAFTFSNVFSSAKRTFRFLLGLEFLLHLASFHLHLSSLLPQGFPAWLESALVLGIALLLSLNHVLLQELLPLPPLRPRP